MKRYIFLIFLASLFACQEEDLVMYSQEKDGLQFSDAQNDGGVGRSFNFAEATYEQDGKTYHYGDSLKTKTFDNVVLTLQGFPTPDERPYKLKTVLLEGQDSTKVAEVLFESYYSLSPNAMRDTVSFTVKRPSGRGTYKVGVVLETEGENTFFEQGVDEQNILYLEIQDRYEEPSEWKFRTDWLGEFSEEKYAFMVSTTQLAFSQYTQGTWRGINLWENTDRFNKAIIQALEAYNASAAPEDRKDFSFPVTTKPIWWDSQKEFLGDFSEEKHEFAKEVVGGELQLSPALEYWNLVLVEEVEKQGITGFSFPVITEQARWWRNSVLGDFSVEKQNFVKEVMYRITPEFQINEDTWTYANVMLRHNLEQYNKAFPDAQLDFEFPVEGKPEWWDGRADLLGDYTPEKRDLAVRVVFQDNAQWWDFSIRQLLDPSQDFTMLIGMIKQEAKIYNAEHPDKKITFPVVVPQWWSSKENELGEYSEEKESFIQQVMSKFGGTYSEWTYFFDWNPIFRYELAAYNAENPGALDFTFPVIDTKPSYWKELPYLGEYSEAKKVFVWMTFLPQNWGSVDGWFLGAPTQWGDPSCWPQRHGVLTDAYAANYSKFMTRYASVNPTPFTFPASF